MVSYRQKPPTDFGQHRGRSYMSWGSRVRRGFQGSRFPILVGPSVSSCPLGENFCCTLAHDAIGGVPRTQGRSLGHAPKLFGGHPVWKLPKLMDADEAWLARRDK